MLKIPIFCHTQKSYIECIFSLLGKGAHHAGLVYSEWFRKGLLLNAAQPQSISLVQEILDATDFSYPQMVAERVEEETVKFLLRCEEGLETESVLIKMQAGNTLCISSQVGCRQGCSFCETGRMGLLRNLTSKEIVAQVFTARCLLKAEVRNIVFMGMGEPLDNYDEVMQAVKILCDPKGMGFGPSRITISTSGCVDAIYKLIEDADPALNLAVSVNAPNDAIRNKIMPVNKKWDMTELKKAMLAYCSHPRRSIFAEYVLIEGVNDSLECADELADYLTGLKAKVNLIPYNPQSRDRYAPPKVEDREAFFARMRKRGYQTLLRHTKGQKIMAACGQLGNLKLRTEMRQRGEIPIL